MRTRWRIALSLLVLSGPIAACGGRNATEPGDTKGPGLSAAAPIRTDRASYTAHRGADYLDDGTLHGSYLELTIGLRYTNPTAGSIYLTTCHGVHPPVLEKKEGTEWVTAFAPIVLQCLGPPEVIHRADTYEYTYRIRAHLPGGRVMPQFETEVPGTYRLAWTAYATWERDSGELGLGRELPLEDRISNEFRIEEEAAGE